VKLGVVPVIVQLRRRFARALPQIRLPFATFVEIVVVAVTAEEVHSAYQLPSSPCFSSLKVQLGVVPETAVTAMLISALSTPKPENAPVLPVAVTAPEASVLKVLVAIVVYFPTTLALKVKLGVVPEIVHVRRPTPVRT